MKRGASDSEEYRALRDDLDRRFRARTALDAGAIADARARANNLNRVLRDLPRDYEMDFEPMYSEIIAGAGRIGYGARREAERERRQTEMLRGMEQADLLAAERTRIADAFENVTNRQNRRWHRRALEELEGDYADYIEHPNVLLPRRGAPPTFEEFRIYSRASTSETLRNLEADLLRFRLYFNDVFNDYVVNGMPPDFVPMPPDEAEEAAYERTEADLGLDYNRMILVKRKNEVEYHALDNAGSGEITRPRGPPDEDGYRGGMSGGTGEGGGGTWGPRDDDV